MQQATASFTEEDRRRINEAVAEAEARTSAEIVPVVAASSGRYDRPEDVVGLWLALVGLVAAWALMPQPEDAAGSWGGMPAYLVPLVYVSVVVVGFILGAVVASRVCWLRRLVTPRKQMAEEVFARARVVFFDSRVHHTTGASGVLIYVSLYEHMAAVIGDAAIMEQLGQQTLDEFCKQLTTNLRRQDPTSAICATLEAIGDVLSGPLPRQEDDVNELPDALILLDSC